MEIKPLGFFRKQLYAMFEGALGRKMTDNEHLMLKNLFMESIKDHRVTTDNTKPLVHHVVCPKCQDIKVKSGQGFKRYKQGIKRAGGSIEAPKS